MAELELDMEIARVDRVVWIKRVSCVSTTVLIRLFSVKFIDYWIQHSRRQTVNITYVFQYLHTHHSAVKTTHNCMCIYVRKFTMRGCF